MPVYIEIDENQDPGKVTKENFKKFLGEESARLTEKDRKKVAKYLKEEKEKRAAIREHARTTKSKGGIVKRYKGGLMVKPKAAKRGY